MTSVKNTNFWDSVDMHIAKANEERKKFDSKQSILLKCWLSSWEGCRFCTPISRTVVCMT